jgi:hypothetical protein
MAAIDFCQQGRKNVSTLNHLDYKQRDNHSSKIHGTFNYQGNEKGWAHGSVGSVPSTKGGGKKGQIQGLRPTAVFYLM